LWLGCSALPGLSSTSAAASAPGLTWSGQGRTEYRPTAEVDVTTPRELLESCELQAALARGVCELDEPFRSAILLRYWRGHDVGRDRRAARDRAQLGSMAPQGSGDPAPRRRGATEDDRDERAWNGPDRGAERLRLIAGIQPALRACAEEAQVAFTLRMTLKLDETGAVSDMRSSADRASTTAAKCAERAVLSAADFAPAPMPTRVSIRIALSPP
jgi:hypothetical protein